MTTTNSASSYSYLSTAGNRFSGLSSGMDVDGIVEKLMKAESAKMEKLQQQKQKYEWQREAYRSVNTKLETFRTDAFDNYGKQSDFVINSVSNSNSSKISATATAAASGTLTISNATIAENAQGVSRTIAGRNENTSVSALGLGAGEFSLVVKQQDGSEKTVNVSYTADDTLETIAQKINKENKGVTAMVGNDGKFSLTSTATGKFDGGTINLSSDTNGLFKEIGFTDDSGNALTELANGKNAQYTINGVTKESQTNSLNVSGYNLQLKENFSENVTISSSLDTTAVVDKIKSFIDTYNALIKDLKGQTSEKKNLSYAPLTDAQKSEMTEDQIKKWEEQAKKGIIRGDRSIENALSSMRSAISGTTIDIGDNKKLSIFDLGIDTNKDGTLVIKNEEKLKSEIEKSPQNVANLFTTSASSNDTGGGIVAQLRSSAKKAVDTIHAKAGKTDSQDNTYTLGKDLISIDKRIEDWKDRLKLIEERYYKQFTAMETAIQKANTQSSIFMQG